MDNKRYQTLTKAEMQLMNILWDMDEATTVAALVAGYPEPQPAYTTVATFLTILEKKGFVARRKSGTGKQFAYYPVVSRQQYTARAMSEMTDSLFGGSVKRLVNFFVSEDMLSREDISELLDMIEK